MEVPETRYAKTSDDVHLAYHVVGEGPVDILWLHLFLGGLEMLWESPNIRSLTAKLNGFARVIRHDMRATGLSDRHRPLPDLETQVGDILAVLDAAGSRSTVLVSAGNPAGAVFAATHPRRTRALCYFDPAARAIRSETYPFGVTRDQAARELDDVERTWGTDASSAALLAELVPTMTADRSLVRWYAKTCRHWVAPGDAVELMRRWYETDISDVLPTISVPTLCLARTFEEGTDEAELVTSMIPDARLAVLPGTERFSAAGDQDSLVDAIREFVGVTPTTHDSDSFLRAVLFTDIVDSTSTAAELGDAGWQELLARHHETVRRLLQDNGGTEEDTTGDGFFATFDGPGRAVRCARAIAAAVRDLGIEIRAGVHTGECTLVEGKTAGITVVIGARVCAIAGPSEVLASQTVKDLVAGSGLEFEDRGEHELKGVPELWRLYTVLGERPEPGR